MTRVLITLYVFYALAQYIMVHGSQRFFSKLKLPSIGSEALAFDPHNGGPYTGLNDGRIVKFHGPVVGFLDFATTVSNWSREICEGTDGSDPETSLHCGKPLGMKFDQKTGELYVVDAHQGLLVVGKEGGVARLLSGGNQMQYDFADAVDICPFSGVVYIVDVGSIFSKTNNITDILLHGSDRTGRLLKYDPLTNRTSLLLMFLAMPAGVAVSCDGTFLLMTEFLSYKLTRYWLRGPKANTYETFLELPGNPDNIVRTSSCDFWVAVNIQKLQPKLTVFPLGMKISSYGKILETVNLYAEYNATYVNEVQEHYGRYYVASVYTDSVGVYPDLGCL